MSGRYESRLGNSDPTWTPSENLQRPESTRSSLSSYGNYEDWAPLPKQAPGHLARNIPQPVMGSQSSYQRLDHSFDIPGDYGSTDKYGDSSIWNPRTPSAHTTDHRGNREPATSRDCYGTVSHSRNPSSSQSLLDVEYPSFLHHLDGADALPLDEARHGPKVSDKPHHTQKRVNRDEFDGPIQFLTKPDMDKIAQQSRDLPHVPVSLEPMEQDTVLRQVNSLLSQCAFDFVAKYQFPIPLEENKRQVKVAGDREWTEWCYLLKRLATKRRIPARVLYNGQIKQLVTVLDSSLEMRHASAHQSRPLKDDRNVLQLISAGTQVAKILKDANTMERLDGLYQQTELKIQERKQSYKTRFR